MKALAVDEQATTRLTNSFERSSPRREFWLLFFGLTLLYVFVLTIGIRRYVWFDELFTFDIARSTSLQQLWYRALKFDTYPPAIFLLSRLSIRPWLMVGKCPDQQPHIKAERHHLRHTHMQTARGVYIWIRTN